MSRSRPSSRPVSRSNSITEAPISLPVDPRVAGPHATYDRSGNATPQLLHGHHHHHNTQDPKLFGPGFASAPVHSAVDSQVRYVLVTPEMLAAIESGNAPSTGLVHPPGTTLKQTQTRSQTPAPPVEQVPILEKGNHGHSESVDHKSTGEITPLPSEMEIDASQVMLANPISRLRHKIKEPLAEFLGTMVLILFGNGVNCQVVLSELTQGNYLSISHGWGIGVMFGVYIAGGVSGAHLSPTVTICLAAFRGFPWRKVPQYCIGQILGACMGSIIIQANYFELLNKYEGGYALRTFGEKTSTATLFFTGAQAYMSNIGAFFSEFIATAVLLAVILCLGDANNNPCPAGMNGLILFFLILGIGAALGTNTAYCLNPARDLGPRIAAAIYGYPSTIWTYRHGYFFWCAILAPICGGLFGCLTYDILVYQGPESWVNKPFEFPWTKRGKAQKAIAAGQA